VWECGTTACIGGWMSRLTGGLRFAALGGYCGFDPEINVGDDDHPMFRLFYDLSDCHHRSGLPSWDTWDLKDPHTAAARINAFLWAYGYPPDEMPLAEERPQSAAERGAACEDADARVSG
jgi:hypothetical protein